jgi:flagellar M-ring protein FliF
MNEKASAFFGQLTAFWKGLSTAKRLVLVLGTLAVLGGTLLVSQLSSRVTYGYLFTELSSEDAASIVQELKKRNIPHQLEAGGSAILVPEEQRHALRLELASEGLPRGGAVGFELFDKAQIGATEFEQQVSLRRALEGELSRSIATLEGVQTARVHLVLPERKLFARQSEGASASVVIKLRNPAAFGRREIAGVVHLVSAAVPGLGRDRISVVSTEGVTLHRPSENNNGLSGLDGSDARAEQERTVASQLEHEVREQLERVVGSGNADVRINVALDAASTERTEEYWDKDTTALRSEHLVEEGVGATEAGVAGVPGARTNLPDAAPEGQAPAEATDGAVGAGQRRARTRNWEVDRVTEKTNLPPGSIQRLSVAVLLNGSYEGVGPDAKFVPRSAEQVQALQQIVRRAVGFNEQRGDSIEMQATQFSRLEIDVPPEAVVPTWRRYLPHAAAALALLIVLGAYILVRRTKTTKKQLAAQAQAAQLAEAARVQQIQRELGEMGASEALPGGAPGAPQLLSAPAEHELRELAVEFATRDPATAAVVLKKWLASAESTPEANAA